MLIIFPKKGKTKFDFFISIFD